MPSPLLADAFGHHIWATLRQLDACAALSDDQLATTVPGTYGPIVDTLRHIVDGDVFYLNVLRGGTPEAFDPQASDIPTMRAVIEAHAAIWQELIAGELDPATVVIEHEDSGYDTHAPLGIRLAQALYHGTEHRGQVSTALTSIGVEAPGVEVWDYARLDNRYFTIESGGAAEPAP